MLIQEHNLKNILFAVKCMIDTHQGIIRENGFKNQHEEVEHATYILEKIHQYNGRAFELLSVLQSMRNVSGCIDEGEKK